MHTNTKHLQKNQSIASARKNVISFSAIDVTVAAAVAAVAVDNVDAALRGVVAGNTVADAFVDIVVAVSIAAALAVAVALTADFAQTAVAAYIAAVEKSRLA